VLMTFLLGRCCICNFISYLLVIYMSYCLLMM